MMQETRLDPKPTKEKAKQTAPAAAKANAAPAVPPRQRRNSLETPRQQSRRVTVRGMEKARVMASANRGKGRQGPRPKAPPSQVMEARQRLKQPSHASFSQRGHAIVELTVLSAMKPPKLTVAKSKSAAMPEEPLAPIEEKVAPADDEAEEEEPLNQEQRLRKEAMSIEHQMSHFPKTRHVPSVSEQKVQETRHEDKGRSS